MLGHVAQLVVQPVEALAHHGGIGRAALHLLEREPLGGRVGPAAPTGEEHAEGCAEEQSHEQHEKQRERRTQVHVCRMPGPADSSVVARGVSWVGTG